MRTVAEVQAEFAKFSRVVGQTETIAVQDALHRVLAQDIVSTIDVPPQDNSAMDGIAVRLSSAQRYRLSQRVSAGDVPSVLDKGTAARIFTGAEIPDGADTVIIQEHCEFEADGWVSIKREQVRGANIRRRGQDIEEGSRVVEAGTELSPVHLALLHSIGVNQVRVYKRLRVGILSTGSELVSAGQSLSAGQIYNSNQVMLASLAQSSGCDIRVQCHINDDLLATQNALREMASQVDIILSSGGVSVGEEDHVKPAVEALGSLDFWKVQMKPGKPVAFGKIESCYFLGLPGNPVSSFIVFQLMAVPLLRALQGAAPRELTGYSVVSGFARPSVSREEYMRVRLEHGEAGLEVHLYSNQSSGVLSLLASADGLVRQPIDHAISVGDTVQFLPFHNGSLW